MRALEEADDLAVLGIRGHAVPEFRREGRRACFDDRVEPLGHIAIGCRQLGDLGEHLAFQVRFVRARGASPAHLHLLDAVLHRGLFRGRESLVPLLGCGGALGGRLLALHWRFPPLCVLMRTTLMLGCQPPRRLLQICSIAYWSTPMRATNLTLLT